MKSLVTEKLGFEPVCDHIPFERVKLFTLIVPEAPVVILVPVLVADNVNVPPVNEIPALMVVLPVLLASESAVSVRLPVLVLLMAAFTTMLRMADKVNEFALLHEIALATVMSPDPVPVPPVVVRTVIFAVLKALVRSVTFNVEVLELLSPV